MAKTLVFDLETQKLAHQVGGWENKDKMLLALAVTYNIEENRYQTYTEKNVDDLIKDLHTANLVIGYNVKNFDYAVLQPYSLFSLDMIPTLDMLEKVTKVLGFRLKLDQLAQATVEDFKSADGLKAVEYFNEGKMKELEEYCQKDVELTYRIYDYGKKNRCLYFNDRVQGKRKIEINW